MVSKVKYFKNMSRSRDSLWETDANRYAEENNLRIVSITLEKADVSSFSSKVSMKTVGAFVVFESYPEVCLK